MKISIIIPVLNEETSIVEHLKLLRPWQGRHEIILVDGGSIDATVVLAKPLVDCVLETRPGRAIQMNAGAEKATGDILLFLHADTVLPCDFDEEVIRAFKKGYSWGRFDVRLSGQALPFRIIEWFMNGRSRLTGISTGDQAIFIAKELFKKAGGFPVQPLMEDIAICSRLKSLDKPFASGKKVQTSSRRWEKRGVVRTVLLMWYLRLAYFLGAPPEKLVRLYR